MSKIIMAAERKGKGECENETVEYLKFILERDKNEIHTTIFHIYIHRAYIIISQIL